MKTRPAAGSLDDPVFQPRSTSSRASTTIRTAGASGAPSAWRTKKPEIGAHGSPVFFLHARDFFGAPIELEEVN